MARILVVVPPLVGHVHPTVPLGRELADRGHQVAWAGHRAVVADRLPAWASLLSVAEDVPPEVAAAVEFHTERGTRGPAAFRSSWEEFVLPVARQMLAGVHAAVDSFAPDLLVVDQQGLAGSAVAELRGLPWVTSATTPAELADPLAELPRVARWLRGQLHDFLVEAGVDEARAEAVDPRFSPHLVVAFTTSELVGPTAVPLPDHYALVGPSIGDRFDDPPFPWEWLDHPVPRVLVSLGTLHWRGGARFFAAAAEALGEMSVRGVVVAPDELVPYPPPNVLVRAAVPQLALLPRVDAVVSHAGHNTVCETLAEGRPLVLAPIRDDQPFIASQVVRAGAGVRVRFGRATADGLRQAIETVLVDPGYRAAARRMGRSFATAGGVPAAVDRIESLLAASPRREHVGEGPWRP